MVTADEDRVLRSGWTEIKSHEMGGLAGSEDVRDMSLYAMRAIKALI